MRIAVHWFRRDLRLSDNTALHAATSRADVVVPVFIFDPKIRTAPDTGPRRAAILLESLRSLEKNVEAAGGKLILRRGDVEEEMRAVLRATGAHALYFNRDHEPYCRQRDAAIEKMARSMGVEVQSFKDGMIHEGEEILKPDGTPYQVFTPYSRIWRSLPKPPVVRAVKFVRPTRLKEPKSEPMPTLWDLGFSIDITLPPGGERAARTSLKQFASGHLLKYATQRNIPALDASSRLSPHLRFGTISPRTVLAVAEETARLHPAARKDVDTFIGELIWRDFYRQILWHFPHVADSCFKPEYNDLKWENNEKLFQAWCEGRTGFPMVDAGMRQLNTTGWMHNRVRMIVSSFLTKDLLVSWQWGERYFMKQLVDADLAANNGGWQWSAGTGTDAQPYFRIFNPLSQAQKFDPEGRYIHKYIPEVDMLTYPAPIVDHARQRMKALALFKRLQTVVIPSLSRDRTSGTDPSTSSE